MLLQAASNSSMSTVGSVSGRGEASVFSHPLYLLSVALWRWASPVIHLLGNFGNILTIAIMSRRRREGAVIEVYFVALACVDLLSLNVLFLFEYAGSGYGYFIFYHNAFLCKVHSWTVGCLTIGGWILVCMTSHRAISVVWPHRVNSLCTRRLVKGLLTGMGLFFAAAYSHYLYGNHLQYSNETGKYSCVMKQGSYTDFIQNYFTYIDLVLYCILPSTLIIVANGVLVWSLRASLQAFQHNSAEKETVTAREKAANSVTVTVMLVSVAYIVLTLPVSIFYISMFIFNPEAEMTVSDHARVYLIRAVTFLLMFLNSAVNFYLYCLSGKKFREEFIKIFCCRPGS